MSVVLTCKFNSSCQTNYNPQSNEYTIDIFEGKNDINNSQLANIKDQIEEIEIHRNNKIISKGNYFKLVGWESNPSLLEPFKIRGLTGGITPQIKDRSVIYNGNNIDFKYPEALCHIVDGKLQVIANNFMDLNGSDKIITIIDLNDRPIHLNSFSFTIEADEISRSTNCIIL